MTSEELLALIPDLPLVVYTHAGQRGIWMDDRGDLRFVASCNDNHGDYTTVLAAAPSALRDALADVARLTAEVARLSAMVPRWGYTHRGRMWRLYCCGVRLLDSGLSAFPGELVLDTTTGDEYPDLPTACASVCARLGLHDIKPPTEGT